MKTYNNRNDNNKTFVGKLITTPTIPVRTAGTPALIGSYAKSDTVILKGESPYNTGSLTNRLNNALLNKKSEIDGTYASELISPMYMRLSNFKINPGGIDFKFTYDADDNTVITGYAMNTAAEQAVNAAFVATQILSVQQRTNIAFFSKYETYSNDVPAFFVTGLNLSYVTVNLTNFIARVANFVAFANYMVTYDKENQNFYMDIAQQFGRRQFVNAMATLFSNLTSLPSNKTLFSMLMDILPLHKASHGFNTPITQVMVNYLDNEALKLKLRPNMSSIYQTDEAPDIRLNISNESDISIDDLIYFLNEYSRGNTNFELTKNGKTYKISEPKLFVDMIIDLVKSVTSKVRSFNATYSDIYAALSLLSGESIISENFQSIDYSAMFKAALEIKIDRSHLEMLLMASSKESMNITKDSLNNISVTAPCYLDFKPATVFSNNSLLYWLDDPSDKDAPQYKAYIDWLNVTIDKAYYWYKQDLVFPLIDIKYTTSGDVAIKVGNNAPQNEWLIPKMSNYLTRIAVYSGDDPNDNYTWLSPMVTGYLRFSYKVVDAKILNNASQAIGFKNTNPISILS